MSQKSKNVLIGASAFTYLFLSMQVALADDTEIYLTRELPADQRVRPNILFVIDTSGSMQSGVPGTNCKSLNQTTINSLGSTPRNWCTSTTRNLSNNTGQLTRMQVVKQVVNQLVDELALSDDSNIGMVRFDSNSNGGFVNVPMQRASSVASTFKTQLSSYYADGSTPLLESYHEAARYMRGETPVYGNNSRGVIENGTGSSTRNPWRSDSGAFNGASYASPIQNSCQKSNIIVLTDGLPNGDSGSNTTIQNLVSGVNQVYRSCKNYPTDGEAGAGCWMPGLSEYLANQDNSPVAGKQVINTYTVGFGNISDTRLLSDTASLGGGRFFTTSDTSGLTTSLRSIIVDILAENTTFTTPTVSVSAYSNFGYRNDLYYALFRPANGARWLGNIKKYRAASDTNGDLVVVDSNGNSAVDPDTGFFRDTAISFWSSAADGKDAGKGGVASRLTSPSTRKVYTYTGASVEPGTTTSVNLTATSNQLVLANNALTKTMLGDSSMTDAYRTSLITWARGTDPSNSATRQQVGDVLHNAPKVVAYVSDEDLQRVADGTSRESLVLFYGTNEGFIGAVDPSTGDELFSFIPQELLPNLKAYYDDAKGTNTKKYGIDGQLGLKVNYGAVDATTKLRPVSSVTLYAGMGRGGRNYHALDVSPGASGAPSTIVPKLKWTIRGGTGGSSGYTRLGQTWSTPKVTKLKLNGTVKDVLVFTGGYDPNQDDDTPNTPSSDTFGNALYIADANTGEKLWMAGPSTDTSANLRLAELTNSMPADPTLVDISGDGLVDTIYTSDTRGQIFRFDINQANTGATNLATGGRIANFGGTTAQDNRRFYNQPDVALIKERGGNTFFTVAIGSGYRGHPLNEDTIDRFYVVRDSNVYRSPATYSTVTEANLVDVTSVSVSGAAAQAIQDQINAKRAEIDALTAAESTARSNFDQYKLARGYTDKLDQLNQTNTEINRKQSSIDTILGGDPYLREHAAEAQARTQLQDLILGALSGLKGLTSLSPATTPSNASSFVDGELNNSELTDFGRLQQSLQELDGNTDSTKYNAVLSAEAALTAARDSGKMDLTAEEASLHTARDDYAATTSYTQRTALLGNLSAINTTLGNISTLQKDIFNTLNADDAADVSAKQSQLDSLKSNLNGLLNGLQDAGSASNTDLLAAEPSIRQTQADLSGVSTPLVSQATLLDTLEAERLGLAGTASTLQAELTALANAAYAPASGLLNSQQLADATAKDQTPPLSQFDAYQYLISLAQLAAANGIPQKRQEINALYAQLTPGDTYTPNPTLLNNSSGWFIRFPTGEKILSSSISFRGTVLFTSFRPSGQQVTTCGPDVGRGRIYAMRLVDASSVFTETINGVETPKRSFDLTHGGIPPKPSIVLRDGKAPGCLVGAEGCLPPQTKCVAGTEFCEADKPVSATYWREN